MYYLNTYGNQPATYSLGFYVLPTGMRANPTVTHSDTNQGTSFSSSANDRFSVYLGANNSSSSAPRANFQADAEL
mgnify:FL=1